MAAPGSQAPEFVNLATCVRFSVAGVSGGGQLFGCLCFWLSGDDQAH